MKKKADKKQINIMTETPRPSLAERTYQTVLDNGLTVFVCPRPGSGTVFAQTVIRTGSVHEGGDLGCGLSHFLEHMVFSGTEKYPGSTQIADNVNRLGGILNASTGYNSTQYYMELPAAAAPDAVDMLGDMLTAPLFPEERFRHEKNVILRESAMRKDNPYSHLLEALLSLMFPGHPAGVPIIGYGEKIAEVNREQMLAYYARRYAPGRTAFVISGDITPDRAADLVAEKVGKWRLGRVDEILLPPAANFNTAQKRKISYNSPLAWLAMGFHEPDRRSPRHAALDVLSNVLAGSESARLIRNLKYRNALADEVSARRMFLPASSLELICAVTAPDKASAALDGIRSTLAELRNTPVEKAELARIVTGLERAFWDVLAGNSGLGKIVSGVFVSGESLEELDSYPDKIREISPEDVQAAAQKYYDTARENLVIQMPEHSRLSGFTSPEKTESCIPEMKNLSCGIRGICIENHSRPMVYFKLCLPGGTLSELPEKAGISDLAAELLACGTKTYSEEQFNAMLDDYAISLSTASESDHIAVEASCMTRHVPQMVKLLKSMLEEPLLDPGTFRREQDILYRQLEDDMSDPVYMAKLKAKEAIFGPKHPFGIPGKKVLNAVKKLTLEDVRNYTAAWDSRTVAGISGDCTAQEGFAILEEILSGLTWMDNMLCPPRLPKYKSGVKKVSCTVKKAQSVVLYAMPAKDMEHFSLEDSLVLQASNGMASRIFKTVREERGLAYYTHLGANISGRYCSSWIGYLAGTRQGAEKQVLELFDEERKLRIRKGFSEEEFTAAAARLEFELVSRLQNPEKMLDASLLHEFRRSGVMRTLENLERLKTVTRKDMNRAAKELFSQPLRVFSAVTPENFSDFPETLD